jgi:predicted transcriptional regulator
MLKVSESAVSRIVKKYQSDEKFLDNIVQAEEIKSSQKKLVGELIHVFQLERKSIQKS